MKKILTIVGLGILAFVVVCGVVYTSERARVGSIKSDLWALLEEQGPNVTNTDAIKKRIRVLVSKEISGGRVRNIRIGSRRISSNVAEGYKKDQTNLDVRVNLAEMSTANYYETTLTMELMSPMVPFRRNKYKIRRVLVSYTSTQ